MKLIARIREAECIGCGKCITACPADAILGSTQWMHTVISDECIGCKLCIPPCPVDCIEMISIDSNPLTSPDTNKMIRKERALHFRKRYQARKIRLEKLRMLQKTRHASQIILDKTAKKAYIEAAILRAKTKK